MVWSEIISYLCGASGLVYGVMNYWLARQKQDAQQKLAEEVQATKTLQELTVHQGQRIEKLEAAVAKCMEAHIEEARKSGQNEGRIIELSTTTAAQSTLIAQQSATIAELKTCLDAYTKNKAA